MININKATKAFKEYIKNYDIKNANIKLKVRHTYGVIKKSEYITSNLKLEDEDVKLAKLIALLHDIGRFEQIKITGEWDDHKTMNHAEYGIKILFEENMIRNFIDDTQYDNIIYQAIKNHNKYEIDKELIQKELLHTKIIRDADKLDILRIKVNEKIENLIPYNWSTICFDKITPNIYEDIMNNKVIKNEERKTQIDDWISSIAFIYDLYYDCSYKFLKDNDYINKAINRIEYKDEMTKKQMEEIREKANEYISQQVINV